MEKVKRNIEVEQVCISKEEFIAAHGKAVADFCHELDLDLDMATTVMLTAGKIVADVARSIFSDKKEEQ